MRYLDICMRLLAFVSFIGLIGTVFLQIFARFFLASSPVWTEELSRFLFIYIVVFCSGLSVKHKELVGVDIIFMFLGKKAIYHRMLLHFIHMIFALVVAFYAIDYVDIGKIQTSPALGIRMDYIFLSVFLIPVFLAMYSFFEIVGLWRMR